MKRKARETKCSGSGKAERPLESEIGNGWIWKKKEEDSSIYPTTSERENDLSTQHPEVLKRLKQRFDDWYQETMFDAEPRGPFKDF